MLVIRQAQLEVLSSQRAREFKVMLTDTLTGLGNERDEIRVQAFIAKVISDANAFGLYTEKQIVRFAVITNRRFGLDPRYLLPKAALAILTSYGVSPSAKLDRYRMCVGGLEGEETDAATF